MIGPKVPKWKVSAESPGVVCAGKSKVDGKRCGKPLNVRKGMWVHGYPERRFEEAGYHIPQIILPKHCEDSASWQTLLNYREGKDNTTLDKFYNEICGVSYDGSSRLITLTELKKACSLPTTVTNLQEAVDYVLKRLSDGTYYDVILSVDWGGGGAKELSFTTMCIACLRYDGKIDIPFGYRSLTPHDHVKEISDIMLLKRKFRCSRIVHDGDGSGPAREAQLKMCNIPDEAFCRVYYIRVGRGSICRWNPGDTRTGARAGYQLDKARGLMWLISYIKNGYMHFFQYDSFDGGKLGLINDFLSLIEDKQRQSFVSDVYTIIRASSSPQPDDFTACCCYALHYFYAHVLRGQYPQIDYLANSNIQELSADLLDIVDIPESDTLSSL
jgi:hypothetical protein